MNTDGWKELLRQAYEEATKSPDPSTQNGALLVWEDVHLGAHEHISDHNRFPDGVAYTSERLERPLKYAYIEHAERNVTYQAAERGLKTAGATMVCPWSACDNCARAIIQSGIRRLVTHQDAYDRTPERWKADIDRAIAMLEEAGVEVLRITGPVGGPPIRFNGEIWTP